MPPKTYSWGPVRCMWSCSRKTSPMLSYLDRDSSDACGVSENPRVSTPLKSLPEIFDLLGPKLDFLMPTGKGYREVQYPVVFFSTTGRRRPKVREMVPHPSEDFLSLRDVWF